MKRMICLLASMMLLCACGVDGTESSSEKVDDKVVQPTTEWSIACEDTLKSYNTEQDFLESAFCQGLREKGATIYVPIYNEEEFSLSAIWIDEIADFYEYRLYDKIKEQGIVVVVNYDKDNTSLSQLKLQGTYTDAQILPVEMDGATYDVLYTDLEWGGVVDYTLRYYPFENYRVSISSDGQESITSITEYMQAISFAPE